MTEPTTTTTSEGDREDDRARLWSLIKDIRFAMFTSRHPNGHLHARPMTTQNKAIDEDDKLYFFMSWAGEPVGEMLETPDVNVSYADPEHQRFVSVSGAARIVTDKAKVRALWTPMADAWFPKGVDDPNLAFVVVDIVHAHYWDMKSSKLSQIYHMAQAALGNKPPQKLGREAEVRMS